MENNGGPAFPRSGPFNAMAKNGNDCQNGMTLRDYIATHALQGLLACPTLRAEPNTITHHLSEWSYKYADAMLAARVAK